MNAWAGKRNLNEMGEVPALESNKNNNTYSTYIVHVRVQCIMIKARKKSYQIFQKKLLKSYQKLLKIVPKILKKLQKSYQNFEKVAKKLPKF